NILKSVQLVDVTGSITDVDIVTVTGRGGGNTVTQKSWFNSQPLKKHFNTERKELGTACFGRVQKAIMGMVELKSTGSSKRHTVTLGSGLMDPSLTVCSLSAKTIAMKHVSMLITCGALLLRRTLLTKAVRKKAASPVSEMSTLIEASGEFRS